MDSITKEPLAEAIFKVIDSKGQVAGTTNGVFKTDEKGFIHIQIYRQEHMLYKKYKLQTDMF